MKYLLDTNVLVAMFRGQYGIRQAILKAGFENCAISEITLAELLTGAYRGGFDRHAHEIAFLRDHFDIVTVSTALDHYARLRAELEKQGTSLDSFALLIAATALSSNLTLITHTTRHFARVPGLRIRDWEKPEEE